MIVCICHRVSHHDIARAVRDGCASFDELQFELAVATGCGACHDCARDTFQAHVAMAAPASAGAGSATAVVHVRRDCVARGRSAQVASA